MASGPDAEPSHEQPHFCPEFVAARIQAELKKFQIVFKGKLKDTQEAQAAYKELRPSIWVHPARPGHSERLPADGQPPSPQDVILGNMGLAVWVPHVQFGELLAATLAPPDSTARFYLPCVSPGCSGCAAPMGAHDCYRCIADVENTVWLGTWKYKCSQCNVSFLGTDPRLVSRLPLAVQEEFRSSSGSSSSSSICWGGQPAAL